MNIRFTPAALLSLALAAPLLSSPAQAASRLTVQVLLKDGRTVEGRPNAEALTLTIGGQTRRLALSDILSVHSADAATPEEQARITANLAAVQGKDRKASTVAAAELTDLGLPVLSPLLAAYQDTDAREPAPLYRLFARIVPGYADAPDRTLDLVRLANGEALRGKLSPLELKLTREGGDAITVPASGLRRLAVRQSSIERRFEIHALRHCTFIDFFDTGVAVTPASRVNSNASGYVRLSFDIDGWASDPDGIQDPIPGKRKFESGFVFGALLGRIGPAGDRWLAGKHVEKTGLGAGRLYFAVNDNEHWQNNIGSFRVKVRVTDAYDLGDPQ